MLDFIRSGWLIGLGAEKIPSTLFDEFVPGVEWVIEPCTYEEMADKLVDENSCAFGVLWGRDDWIAALRSADWRLWFIEKLKEQKLIHVRT